MDEIEEWREIPDFPNYKISTQGEVRAVNYRGVFRPGRRPSIRESALTGRAMVTLIKPVVNERITREHELHNLVLQAFNPNFDPDQHWVAHRDGDPMNCELNNLRWG